jgi:hypothetical protein
VLQEGQGGGDSALDDDRTPSVPDSARPEADGTPGRRPPRCAEGPKPRIPLAREEIAARAFTEDDPELTEDLQNIWDLSVAESKAAAVRMRALAPLWADRDAPGAPPHAGDAEDAEAAISLRCTIASAYGQIRDAHEALTIFPTLFARLEQGDLPIEWLRRVLRRTRELPVEDRRMIDELMGSWEFGVTPETFRRLLSELVCWLTSLLDLTPLERAEQRRRVEPPQIGDDGMASVSIVGPIPEITAFAQELDAAATTLQRAQRHAIAEGEPIPFDDGTLAAEGKPFSRARLRYEALRHGALDTDGLDVPAERFRMLMTVPAMTLMGESDAPGMLDGRHPVPADMARELAAGQEDWYRILTDPVTGAYLPLPPERYTPTPAMLEHLRLRSPECALPGCSRPSRQGAEADHIEEFDHENPEAGGRTALDDLHLLCTGHHQLKTAREIDPVRIDDPSTADPSTGDPPGTSHPPSDAPRGFRFPSRIIDESVHRRRRPGRTRWELRGTATVVAQDARDLLTPLLAQDLDVAWERHRATGPIEAAGNPADDAGEPSAPPDTALPSGDDDPPF